MKLFQESNLAFVVLFFKPRFKFLFDLTIAIC